MTQDYSELVKRLRSAARAQAAGGGWADPCAVDSTIDWNAAAALEAQAAEIARLHSVVGEAYQVVGALSFMLKLDDHEDVVRALDVLSDPIDDKRDILPFRLPRAALEVKA